MRLFRLTISRVGVSRIVCQPSVVAVAYTSQAYVIAADPAGARRRVEEVFTEMELLMIEEIDLTESGLLCVSGFFTC